MAKGTLGVCSFCIVRLDVLFPELVTVNLHSNPVQAMEVAVVLLKGLGEIVYVS